MLRRTGGRSAAANYLIAQKGHSVVNRFVLLVVGLALAFGLLGYWRGWYHISNDGKVDVQVDQAKFGQDKDEFRKTAGDKVRTMKDEVADLWRKSEGLKGEDKAQTQKELDELTRKRDRLEEQLRELNDAGPDRFQSLNDDVSKSLDDVRKRIDELNRKLDKQQGK